MNYDRVDRIELIIDETCCYITYFFRKLYERCWSSGLRFWWGIVGHQPSCPAGVKISLSKFRKSARLLLAGKNRSECEAGLVGWFKPTCSSPPWWRTLLPLKNTVAIKLRVWKYFCSMRQRLGFPSNWTCFSRWKDDIINTWLLGLSPFYALQSAFEVAVHLKLHWFLSIIDYLCSLPKLTNRSPLYEKIL